MNPGVAGQLARRRDTLRLRRYPPISYIKEFTCIVSGWPSSTYIISFFHHTFCISSTYPLDTPYKQSSTNSTPSERRGDPDERSIRTPCRPPPPVQSHSHRHLTPLATMLFSLLSISLLGSFLGVSAAPATNHTFAARQGVNTGFPYGQEKVRGVNLGGWLVLGTSHVSSHPARA